jgi:hypothetical protein
LRADGKMLDRRRKSDQPGGTGIKKNHRGRKIFEKKTNSGRCALNNGQENLAQKKLILREQKKTRISDPDLAKIGRNTQETGMKIIQFLHRNMNEFITLIYRGLRSPSLV